MRLRLVLAFPLATLAACGTGGAPPGSDLTPSATATEQPTQSSPPPALELELAGSSDPHGRFTFEYPKEWIVADFDRTERPNIDTFEATNRVGAVTESGWDPGGARLSVGFGPAEYWAPIEGGQRTERGGNVFTQFRVAREGQSDSAEYLAQGADGARYRGEAYLPLPGDYIAHFQLIAGFDSDELHELYLSILASAAVTK